MNNGFHHIITELKFVLESHMVEGSIESLCPKITDVNLLAFYYRAIVNHSVSFIIIGKQQDNNMSKKISA